MTTAVKFEIAMLLKEKEFSYTGKCYYENEIWLVDTLAKFPHGTLKMDICFPAPTIAEVVMWLYDKHSIWVECLHRGDMGDFTFKASKLKNGWRKEPHYIHESGFNTPTEAYDAAIEYCLTNLI